MNTPSTIVICYTVSYILSRNICYNCCSIPSICMVRPYSECRYQWCNLAKFVENSTHSEDTYSHRETQGFRASPIRPILDVELPVRVGFVRSCDFFRFSLFTAQLRWNFHWRHHASNERRKKNVSPTNQGVARRWGNTGLVETINRLGHSLALGDPDMPTWDFGALLHCLDSDSHRPDVSTHAHDAMLGCSERVLIEICDAALVYCWFECLSYWLAKRSGGFCWLRQCRHPVPKPTFSNARRVTVVSFSPLHSPDGPRPRASLICLGL